MDSSQRRYAEAFFNRSSDTAHDLKTPLNIAVLNLELLRIRLRKLTGGEDEKLIAYTAAIEMELRRLGKIFDAFFTFAVPPKGSPAAEQIDLEKTLREVVTPFELQFDQGPAASCWGSPGRLRELLKHFLEGGTRMLDRSHTVLTRRSESNRYNLQLRGPAASREVEVEKLFKFYFTDAEGAADLSLATARLIAETCGGEITAHREGDDLLLELSLPLGEQ
ncbi:MAG TPA: hypothetical protein VHL58_14515 [Thermoanaerobaculia bacterium]|nr:hypothetical protein [Thermoanaerobaculia bacterium]